MKLIKNKIERLIIRIFCLWSLRKAENNQKENKKGGTIICADQELLPIKVMGVENISSKAAMRPTFVLNHSFPIPYTVSTESALRRENSKSK